MAPATRCVGSTLRPVVGVEVSLAHLNDGNVAETVNSQADG